MDHTDRIRGLRHTARLLRGRLDRPAGARPTRVARPLFALTALLLVLTPGAPAWAHNALAEASPAKGAMLKKSPREVRLRFLQKLDPDSTTITVSNAGDKVGTSAPKVNGATGVVTMGAPLPNGVYTVAYQVRSTDGHTVKGSYEFTVDDPAPAPVTSESEAPGESLAPSTAGASPVPTGTAPVLAESSDDSGSTIAGLVIGIVAVLAAVAAFLFIRRRKVKS